MPTIVRKPVSDLASDPANARKHNERNLDAIKASLTRFGQQKPIVIDSSGVVRAGNGTLAAAKALGWAEIDCVVSDLQGAEAVAYAIADNRTAELAEWDDDVLTATLQSLADEDPALLVDAGFTEADLNAMLPPVEGFPAPVLQEELNHGEVTIIFTEPDGRDKLIKTLKLVHIQDGMVSIRWPQLESQPTSHPKAAPEHS